MATARKPRILCIDDDRDVAEVVQAILVDAGYSVSCLYEVSNESIQRAVGRLEPDVVLLDGVPGKEYGSWESAAWIEQRSRYLPVVMFSAHHLDVMEATEGLSQRAREAGFFAIVEKPFHVDELLEVVERAAGQAESFERSEAAENDRTKALVAALKEHRAEDIEPSTRREWATFRDARRVLWQIYWWQERGVYQVGRFKPDGGMEMVGQFTDLAAALELALPS
jgi:DNA-binding NtrC family response regulator